jgi:hypothetical protein
LVNRKVEEQLEMLSALRAAGPGDTAIAALRSGLRNRVNVVVAKSAALADEFQLKELMPELLQAFERLFADPVKSDPQCWGKNALARAIKDLGHADSALFVRGARHIQMEPVWGGQEDTAPTLRGTCLLALVQCTDITRERVLRHLVDALADRAKPVRIDAVRTLREMEGMESALLLRLKAKAGDRETEVTGQVFDSLLALERDEAIPFVAEFLASEGDDRQEAALALGASDLAESVPILTRAWEHSRMRDRKQMLLRAMSASRQQSSREFLLRLVQAGRSADCLDALEALALHKGSAEVREEVKRAVAQRGEDDMQTLFNEIFRHSD